MANNTTYGVHRIQEANLTASNNFNGSSLTGLEDTIGNFFITQMAGSYELAGLLVFLAMSYGTFKANISTGVQASILTPLLIVLAVNGFLPGSSAIMYGILVVVAGVSIFGLFRFID